MAVPFIFSTSAGASGYPGVSGYTNGGTGRTNTGGGGGSSYWQYTSGGNGGSGCVIVSSTSTPASTTGSPTLFTNGSYKVYKFTGSGSITF